MKLERFKERKQKKIGIIVGISSIVLLFAAVIVYRTYSIYQESQEFDVIKGNVPDQNYDVMFTFYLLEEDGTKKRIETIPEGKEYRVNVECNQEALGSWDRDTWGPVIKNLTHTRTKCNATFENAIFPLKEYGIEELEVTEGSGLYKVPHEDANITYTTNEEAIANLKKTEYRYAGSSPNNYVTFNGEVAGWRIIGLVNTPEGQRLKLIRDESIGEYSWDSSVSNVNAGMGSSEWSQSRIKRLINNGAYYNRVSSSCYNGPRNTTVSCDFTQNGLTSEAKEMIDTVTWNTGTNGKNSHENITVKQFYNYERSSNNGNICSSGEQCTDTITRTTSWKGQIGLMYSSDYGYASSGSNTTSRNSCLNSIMYNWSGECRRNDWLYNPSYQWTITPTAISYYRCSAFSINNSGNVNSNYAYGAFAIRPAIYLTLNIKFINGNGTKENPYHF